MLNPRAAAQTRLRLKQARLCRSAARPPDPGISALRGCGRFAPAALWWVRLVHKGVVYISRAPEIVFVSNMHKIPELPQNRLLHWSARISLLMSIVFVAVFSLMNAGITNSLVIGGAIGVCLVGVYVSTRLKEVACGLDLQSKFAGPANIRCAIALPVLLAVAFLILLALQFS